MTTIVLPRKEDGTLQAFAWPGGYPIYYLVADGGFLCPDCANGKNGSLASSPLLDPDCPDDRQWRVIAAGVHYEGSPIVCDHCNADIESAYGDPDAK